MAYISLYRKYRPQTFSDVVGQKVIISILKNSIINNKIGHAYIFSGPRGTGKTSTAKIFARAVNCLKPVDGDICCECDVCKLSFDDEIDIVEIDAASNNGVEEIREIKNSIKLLPSELKYKVYIIDEVHMLSTSAFNALLKTLEEPPAHAIFILATTEINKIPLTVLSRCQKFDFKKISKNDIVNRLKFIINKENIDNISDDILDLIADLSDGGLRDAINLLDQVYSLNKDKITRTDVLNLTGSIDLNSIYNLLDSISSCEIEKVIKYVDDFYDNENNFINVVNKLESLIKDIVIFNNSTNYFDKDYENRLFNYSKININKLLDASEMLFALSNELKRNNKKIVSEIYFLKISLIFKDNVDNKEKNILKNEESINATINSSVNMQNVALNDKNIITNKNLDKDRLINNAFYGANKDDKTNFISKFNYINEYLTNKTYNSVSSLLLKSTPEVVSNKVILFSFKNNFEVVLFDKNIDLIKKLLKKIYDISYDIVAISNEEWKIEKNNYIKNIKSGVKYKYIEEEKKVIKKNNSELENSVENIFGDEIVVED